MSKRGKPLQIVERIEDIPAFASERDEADFWQTHRFSDALLDAAPPYTAEEAPPARPSAAIALRIDPLLLARLQRLAAHRDVPYQRLLKQFVEERVVEEEAAAAVPALDPALVRELGRSMARRARELERDALRLTAAS